MIGEFLDRVIGTVAPDWGLRRMAARATMAQIEAFGSTAAGYDGGKKNRLTKHWQSGNVSENAIDIGQVQVTSGRAWSLYRNTTAGRKIVRSTCAKVVGRGLRPLSLATNADGTPNDEFRQRAAQVWDRVACHLDYRGRPERGGLSFAQLCKQALRACMLSGEVLYRLKPLNKADMLVRGASLPLGLQLIHGERLDMAKQGDGIYRGIEFNQDGTRKQYWILDHHPSETPRFGLDLESHPIKAAEIGHLYFADDVDQIRGVTWMAPALIQMRDTQDYQYNELKAAAVGACVVMGIRRPTGAPMRLGLNQRSGDSSTDGDDNPLTSMQPGQIFNLGSDGEIQGFNPARPATNAEAWISHMQRSTAGAFPGLKSSTLTGDYRNSSFSSEKSADNDTWPEIEEIQDWLAEGFCHPVYEAVIKAAVLSGMFDGVVSPAEFEADMARFTAATWQGPVARAINPQDEAKAAALEIEAGVSSLQIECAKRGRDWRQVMKDQAEAYQFALSLGLPDELALQLIGMNENVVSGLVSAAAAEESSQTEEGDAAELD